MQKVLNGEAIKTSMHGETKFKILISLWQYYFISPTKEGKTKPYLILYNERNNLSWEYFQLIPFFLHLHKIKTVSLNLKKIIQFAVLTRNDSLDGCLSFPCLNKIEITTLVGKLHGYGTLHSISLVYNGKNKSS